MTFYASRVSAREDGAYSFDSDSIRNFINAKLVQKLKIQERPSDHIYQGNMPTTMQIRKKRTLRVPIEIKLQRQCGLIVHEP